MACRNGGNVTNDARVHYKVINGVLNDMTLGSSADSRTRPRTFHASRANSRKWVVRRISTCLLAALYLECIDRSCRVFASQLFWEGEWSLSS